MVFTALIRQIALAEKGGARIPMYGKPSGTLRKTTQETVAKSKALFIKKYSGTTVEMEVLVHFSAQMADLEQAPEENLLIYYK
jgi:hypothetical protein